jgi:ribosomal protein S6--L-glutamate ligase
MILSFHPCFSGDRFINCGGRNLTADDISAIKQASAVILPQACRRDLYEAAVTHCVRVFPDFDRKFRYPGKSGQIRLFRETGTPHPETRLFADTADFYNRIKDLQAPGFDFPVVLKLNGADEGHGVFPAKTPADLAPFLELAAGAEKRGDPGFLVQDFIETGGRVLRVCVIYKTIKAYWRVGRDPGDFRVNIARGAAIDHTTRPDLMAQGIRAVRRFCDETGINLAGFDLIFSSTGGNEPPLFLEINYYFGRRGLGGTRAYYQLLTQAVEQWLTDQKETVAPGTSATA